IQQMSMEVTAEGWGGDDLEERCLWVRLEMSKDKETTPDQTQEIKKNYNTLKSKLSVGIQ
ncbi:5252_t:CDS:2, partial [Gigaspora rosea]